jgi:L-malate glycosyltransferase
VPPREPIRVLHLLPHLLSGGVERRRLSLARRLPAQEFEQRVLCIVGQQDILQQFEDAGTLVRQLGGSWAPWDVRSAMRVRRQVHEYGPDIVHGAVFEGVSMATYVSFSLASVKVVVEETSLPIARSRRATALFRWMAAHADCCVAVSPAVDGYLTRIGVPASRRRLVVNGVEDPPPPGRELVLQARAELGLKPDDLVFGSIGRVRERDKRFSVLVRAFREVSAKVPHARLLIVGDGPDLDSLRNAAWTSGLCRQVVLPGYRANAMLMHHVMDVFCLVSAHESFGLVLVEAMLAGRPTICTGVGGMSDIVIPQQTGLLVPVDDPGATAEAMIRMAQDAPGRIRMGAAGRARAVEHFLADRYVNDVAALYRSLLR